MTVGITQVLFLAAAMLAAGGFVTGYRGSSAALAGVPIMAAGAGLALVGVSRFAASASDPFGGQAFAVLAAISTLALIALGSGWLAAPREDR